MIELRCENKKHAVMLTDGSGTLEVACNSTFCGARKGIVVLHRFDLETGSLAGTQRFKTPTRKERGSASNYSSVALRAS